MLTPAYRELLRDRMAGHHEEKERFFRATESERAGIFEAIRAERNRLLDRIVHGPPPIPAAVLGYAVRADWALLDLVTLAAATGAGPAALARAVAPRALVFHALRMLDDVLDDHTDYKGGEPTLLGEFRAGPAVRRLAVPANLLPMTMIVCWAGATLDRADRELVDRTLRGMAQEYDDATWTLARYRDMVDAKMGAYGMLLYRPVLAHLPADTRGSLGDFLVGSFAVAQILNDLQDREDDAARQQPNYWLLDEEEHELADAFVEALLRLSAQGAALSPQVSPYAHARLADLLSYLFQILPDPPRAG